jgi:hypothetical protein
MKSFILSLALFQLLTGVHASVRAGPYTLMIEWHVYRMEVLRLGNGKTLVAPGCRGTVPDGSCYFDEFCKHIQMKKVWQGRTSAGHDLFPYNILAALARYWANYPPATLILRPASCATQDISSRMIRTSCCPAYSRTLKRSRPNSPASLRSLSRLSIAFRHSGLTPVQTQIRCLGGTCWRLRSQSLWPLRLALRTKR